MPALTLLDAITFLGVAVAAVVDVRTAVSADGSLQAGRIPNAITFGIMLLGLGVHVVDGDPLVAILGVLVAFFLHFPLWALGVDGAGDAKLMMGIGATWGWAACLETTFWTYVLFLPIGVLLLLARGRLTMLVHALSWSFASLRGQDPGPRPPPTFWPRGPVILAACGMAWATSILDFFGG